MTLAMEYLSYRVLFILALKPNEFILALKPNDNITIITRSILTSFQFPFRRQEPGEMTSFQQIQIAY